MTKSCGNTPASSSCCSKSASVKSPVVVASSPMEAKVFVNVNGMTCQGCCTRIEGYLLEQDGIRCISISLLTHKAEIVYDTTKVSSSTIVDMIDKLGFKATELMDRQSCSVAFRAYAQDTEEVQKHLKKKEGVLSISMHKDLIMAKFDPEKTGARALYHALQEQFGGISLVSADMIQSDKYIQQEQIQNELEHRFWSCVVLSIPIVVIHLIYPMLYATSIFDTVLFHGLSWKDLICGGFAIPIQLFLAQPIYESAYASLYYSGRSNMDVLITLSTVTAFGFSVLNVFFAIIQGSNSAPQTFFEVSAMLVTFILLGRVVEQRAKKKTTDSVRALLKLQVKTAILLQESSSGGPPQESYIEMELVQRGDLLKILPGSKCPTDGIVVEGQSKVDEALITGESTLVTKQPDSLIIGGTMNQNGVLIMRATRAANETMLSQIVQLVEDAQTSKPDSQRVADIIASYFTTVIILLALTMFVVWYVLAESRVVTVPPEATPFSFALRFAITILVISCPCAISLSVPSAVMVATGVAAKHGVLFRGGQVIEAVQKVDTILFDKTGTLTVAKPKVVDVRLLSQNGKKTEQAAKEFWALVGSAESNSEHPLGKAIVHHAESLGCQFSQAKDIVIEPGNGIAAMVNSKKIHIGSLRWMQHQEIVGLSNSNTHSMDDLQQNGSTIVYVGIDGQLAGAIALKDAPRAEAKAVIDELKARGIEIWMITGDNAKTARTVAHQLEIDESCVISGVLPSGKAEHVCQLQSLSRVVAFVGDGINDSPALACADVGIAIGAGADVAVQTADLILIKENLVNLLNALDLADVTFKRIQWNFFWGFIYNLCMMPIASGALFTFGILIPTAFAGLSELFSSVPVIVLSLLLNFWKPKYHYTEQQFYGSTPPLEPSLFEAGTQMTETSPLLRRSM